MYGYMIINFKKCTDSDLVIYSFKNCTGANLYRKVKEKAIVLTCDILHNVLRWGIVQCVTIFLSSHPVFCHLFFFGCQHTLLGIYSQPGGKLLNVSLINFLCPAWVGCLYIPKSVCGRVWDGLHLQYPIRGQIVMSCYFHVPFYLKTPFHQTCLLTKCW